MSHPATSYFDQANALKAQSRLDEAAACYRQALQLDPSLAEAYYGLGLILYESGRYQEAVECHRQAIRLRPRYHEAYHGLGLVFRALSDYQQALDSARRALEINPENQDAIALKAGILERLGEPDRAYALLQPLVDAGTNNTNVAVAFASLSRRFDVREKAIAFLERLLAQPALEANRRLDLHFELGRLYDEMQRYDEAFAHYRSGNALKPTAFNLALHQRIVDEFIKAFSSATVPQLARSSYRADIPVFIVGMPRSGTSLTEQILASHPAVHGGGELNFHQILMHSLPSNFAVGKAYPEFLRALTPDILGTVAQRYVESLRSLAPTAVRVTDKMPYNFMHLGLIDLLFPDARVIHCVRDPLDTCLSCYFQHFASRHDYAYDLTNLGLYYRQYERLMTHWKGVLRIPLLEVAYENLVSEPENVIRRMVEFCGLPWHPQCLRFHEVKRIIKTASYEQARRPLYTQSVARWKNYTKHLEPLRAALRAGV